VRTTIKRALLLVTGWAFVLVGIAGLFLPVLQGVLMILIGLVILSGEYVWAHRLLQKLRARYPRLSQKLDQARERGNAWLRKFSGRSSDTGS